MPLSTRGACASRSALYSESGTIHMSRPKVCGGVKTSGCEDEVDTSSNAGILARAAGCDEDGLCGFVGLAVLVWLERADCCLGMSFSIEGDAGASCMMGRMSEMCTAMQQVPFLRR
jgi:hypothetical protein